MRYPASEKAEIIRLVAASHLPARRTLETLGIPRASFYSWHDRYRTGGIEALCDHRSRPDCVWNRILLENDYPPEDLERQVAAFVAHYNHARHHESLGNLTPADLCFGRGQAILAERERVKRQTIQQGRLQHHMQAA